MVRTTIRGALRGAAFGLAAACFELWVASLKMLDLHMPAMPANVFRAAVLEVVLGAVLGTIAAPLLRARRGALWHVLALALAWLALERIVAPDPSIVGMWLSPPLVALVIFAVGSLVARRWPWVPWTIGAAILAGAIVAPIVLTERRLAGERERAAGAGDRDATARPPAATDERHVVAEAAGAPRPDVVIVVLDTVRAQSTSAYGYGRATTPYLERLAAEGALFLDATSPSTWSLPSHASLFTGRYPSSHGAHGEHRFLEPTSPTLAEVLAANGYDTRCFTANPHISDSFGLTRGFAWSDRAWLGATGGRSFMFVYRVADLVGFSAQDKGGGSVAANVERWASSRRANDRPAFVFVNFLEAHFPYHQVPPDFLAKFSNRSPHELRGVSLEVFGAQFGRQLSPAEIAAATEPSRDMYDAGVAYSDYLLSRVVEALRRAGTLDRTLLVVLADHGEMVGEHGLFGHGAALYQEAIQVPLVLRFPAYVEAGARASAPVSTLGVYATVLDLLGIEAPSGLQVGSLMPALSGRAAGAPVMAERFVFPGHGRAGEPIAMTDRRYRVYRSGSQKLIQTSRGETFLFDLRSDPGESRDLAGAQPADVVRLAEELSAWTKTLGIPPLDALLGYKAAPAPDAAAAERLRALGYAN